MLGLGAVGQTLPAPPAPLPRRCSRWDRHGHEAACPTPGLGSAPGELEPKPGPPFGFVSPSPQLQVTFPRASQSGLTFMQTEAGRRSSQGSLSCCRLLFGYSRCCYRPKAAAPRTPASPPGWRGAAVSGLCSCRSEKHNDHPLHFYFFFPCQLEALTPTFLGVLPEPPSAWRPVGWGRARSGALSPLRRGWSTRAPAAGEGAGGLSPLPPLFPRSPAFTG